MQSTRVKAAGARDTWSSERERERERERRELGFPVDKGEVAGAKYNEEVWQRTRALCTYTGPQGLVGGVGNSGLCDTG